MRRREFITLIGGAAAAWPIAARAQQPGKLPTIGFVAGNALAWRPWTATFVARLRELGWIEDRTIKIEYRWGEGRNERFAEIGAEFVRRQVDVIVAGGNVAVVMKQATSVIPIVFVLATDPIGMGLVGSLARPSGNITGLANQQSDTAGKRVELLREVVPGLRRLGIMMSAGFREAVNETHDVQTISNRLGLTVVTFEIRSAEDIPLAFTALTGQADALYVTGDALTNTNRMRINTLALAARMPTVYGFRDMVETGGLMSYGAKNGELFRRAAEFVDKILHGTKPSDIPVEQATTFELIVNLTTAKALGLTIPEAFLLRADDVIE